jgi:AcrR family transcriptional regulator
MQRETLIPAPGRGAYDRSLSRAERDAQHRARLIIATAEVLAEGPATVARIAERAGVGRSTFYEFFDSPEHVQSHLVERVQGALRTGLATALQSARTPLERFRALARAWLSELEARPLEAKVALTPRASSDLLSPAGVILLGALRDGAELARQHGMSWTSSSDDASLLAAAAAVATVTRQHLTGPALVEAPRALSEILTRLLR